MVQIHVCRLPFAVNVTLNLSSVLKWATPLPLLSVCGGGGDKGKLYFPLLSWQNVKDALWGKVSQLLNFEADCPDCT